MSKACQQCDVDKKLSDFWTINCKSKPYRSICKDCVIAMEPTHRSCKTCGTCFEKSNFYRNNHGNLYGNCKQCRNKQIMQQRQTGDARLKHNLRVCKYYKTPKGRLIHSVRTRISQLIKKGKAAKHNKLVILMGCSFEELKLHLESLFTPEMTWENYAAVWEIDHIQPLASFDLTELAQMTQAVSWRNLQPLLIASNRAKSDWLPNGTRGRTRTVV